MQMCPQYEKGSFVKAPAHYQHPFFPPPHVLHTEKGFFRNEIREGGEIEIKGGKGGKGQLQKKGTETKRERKGKGDLIIVSMLDTMTVVNDFPDYCITIRTS